MAYAAAMPESPAALVAPPPPGPRRHRHAGRRHGAIGLLPALLLSMAGAVSAAAVLAPPDLIQRQDAGWWIARWPGADRIVLDRDGVTATNARLFAQDPALVRLDTLPDTLPGDAIATRIEALSRPPSSPRWFADGRAVTPGDIARWTAALDLAVLAGRSQALGWALVTRRAALRTFPTDEAIFSDPIERDLDRLQESALFPGTPVAVLHASADGRWRFVQAATYVAWVRDDALAHAPRATVLGYAARATRVVTAAEARLATSPDAPVLSGLVLDMGTTLPERRGVDPALVVNGQAAMGNPVVELPVRTSTGRLAIAPALLPRSEASHDGPLPASRANVLRQAFRFLGERYGWGHGLDGRDCSGFVSEVYRSVGLWLPRNTRDQAGSPAFSRTAIAADLPRDARLALLRRLAPGDLVYLPGHVVMVVGHDADGPWVIHDVHRTQVPDGRGGLAEAAINGVAVTPLLPLHTSDGRPYIDVLTAIQQVLPPEPEAAP